MWDASKLPVTQEPRHGMTLTRKGWTSKQVTDKRNQSPGMGKLLRQDGDAPQPRQSVPIRRSWQAHSSDNIRGLMNQGQVLAGPSTEGARQRSPPRGSLGPDRFQTSSGVKVALSELALAAQSDAAPKPTREAALAARVVAPWDVDQTGREITAVTKDSDIAQRLTEVARTALQANVLRANAEKLFLRDMDMTSNCLTAGSGVGRGGTFQPVGSVGRLSPRDSVKEQPSTNSLAHCREQVESAVAALMSASGSVSSGMPRRTATGPGGLGLAARAARRRTSPELRAEREAQYAPLATPRGVAAERAAMAVARAVEREAAAAPPPLAALAAPKEAPKPEAAVRPEAPPSMPPPMPVMVATTRPAPLDTSCLEANMVTRSKSIPTPTRQLSHGGA